MELPSDESSESVQLAAAGHLLDRGQAEQVAAWGSWTFPVPVGCQKLAVLLPGTLQRLPSVFSALKRQQSVVFTHLVFL